MKVIPETSHVY